jgi:hypothetical protein
MRRCSEQKAAVSDSGYSQIAGDTPATTANRLRIVSGLPSTRQVRLRWPGLFRPEDYLLDYL